jgi:hypothetical protein
MENSESKPVVEPARFKSFLGNWTKQLFAIDPRSLAALRIAVGCLILLDLLIRSTDLVAHYTDSGILPRRDHYELARSWYFSLHLLNGRWQFQALMFLISAGFAGCLILGYYTRLVTVASWILIVSLQNRLNIVIQGGDTLLKLLLFWGIFLPWGSYLSLDAKQNRKTRLHLPVLSVGTFGYMVQVLLVYLFAFLLKTGDSWKNGLAVYYALSVPTISRPLGEFLVGYPELLKFVTHAVLYFEGIVPVLLFFPWRTPYVRSVLFFLLAGLHLSFGLMINIGIFPLISTVAAIGFLPGWFWDRTGWNIDKSEETESVPSGRAKRIISYAINTVAAGSLLLIVWWNIGLMKKPPINFPKSLKPIIYGFRLNQEWNLFAPGPRRSDGWIVVPALTADGKQIDLRAMTETVTWERPESIAGRFKNYRWRKYFRRLRKKSYRGYRKPCLNYLERVWNESHPIKQKIVSSKLYYMKVYTPLPGDEAEIEKIPLRLE